MECRTLKKMVKIIGSVHPTSVCFNGNKMLTFNADGVNIMVETEGASFEDSHVCNYAELKKSVTGLKSLRSSITIGKEGEIGYIESNGTRILLGAVCSPIKTKAHREIGRFSGSRARTILPLIVNAYGTTGHGSCYIRNGDKVTVHVHDRECWVEWISETEEACIAQHSTSDKDLTISIDKKELRPLSAVLTVIGDVQEVVLSYKRTEYDGTGNLYIDLYAGELKVSICVRGEIEQGSRALLNNLCSIQNDDEIEDDGSEAYKDKFNELSGQISDKAMRSMLKEFNDLERVATTDRSVIVYNEDEEGFYRHIFAKVRT